MFYQHEIRNLLKPAGLADSQDCIETFKYVGDTLLSWLSEEDKPEIAEGLGKAALTLKEAAKGKPEVSGKVAAEIFRHELKGLFKKIEASIGCSAEEIAFGSGGMLIRETLVLTTAPLDNNPIQRTIRQKKRGQALAEGALKFKGCFYWAGPSDVDYSGAPSAMTERKPGTISLESAQSKKVFKELGLQLPDGSFHHPVGGKVTVDQLMHDLKEMNRNDFTQWLVQGTDPTTEFRCNCWEAILISAWWADLIDREKLLALYLSMGKTATLTDKSFASLLLTQVFAFHKSQMLVDHVHPFEGDIIFFDGAAHLAVATGNNRQVMSLWHQEDSSFAEVSIDFLKGQVGGNCEARYVPCPF